MRQQRDLQILKKGGVISTNLATEYINIQNMVCVCAYINIDWGGLWLWSPFWILSFTLALSSGRKNTAATFGGREIYKSFTVATVLMSFSCYQQLLCLSRETDEFLLSNAYIHKYSIYTVK
jgi:hypothetical protein